MKPFNWLVFFFVIVTTPCIGQDATFNYLTIRDLTKSGGAAAIFGWGDSPDNTLDARPNSRTDALPYMINHHTGLTLSAHSSYGGIRFYNQGYPNPYDPVGSVMVMSITNGNVGIGTGTPSSKLAVNGNIKAKEIKVEIANWPDYVFDKAYSLPTLQETEKHILEKGHLHGIPSAANVKANGVDLGEMNAKLLLKIEELTLHLIQKDKEIKNLQNLIERIVQLENKFDKISRERFLPVPQ